MRLVDQCIITDMETANSSEENIRYNEQSNFLDSFYEFHPDWFDKLDQKEIEAMESYYLLNRDVPENVFERRATMAKQNPKLVRRAKDALKKVLQLAQVNDIDV